MRLEYVEKSDAGERNDAAIDDEGTLIEGTEAPTAKSTTRGTNQTATATSTEKATSMRS